MNSLPIVTPVAASPAYAAPSGTNDPSNTGTPATALSQNAGQTQDTAPPAPTPDAGSGQSSPRSGGDRDSTTGAPVVILDPPTSDRSSARSAVEANYTDSATGTERAAAEDATERLEQLLEAVQEPPATTNLNAPTAAQADAGPVETEGTPL